MIKTAFFTLLIVAFSACAENVRKMGDLVMVTPDNTLLPTGAVASVTQIATVAAQAEANAQALTLLQAAEVDVNAKADAFEAAYQAREGTIWIDAFNVWRIGEISSINTNVTAQIIKFDSRVSGDSTNWYNRTYTFFNEDPGYTPFVRMGRSMGATNLWELAGIRSTWSTNITVGSTLYEGVTVTEFATPKAWTSAFFRVASEVRGAGTNATYFPVNNGIQVKGETPLTLKATFGTNVLRIVGGIVCTPL